MANLRRDDALTLEDIRQRLCENVPGFMELLARLVGTTTVGANTVGYHERWQKH